MDRRAEKLMNLSWAMIAMARSGVDAKWIIEAFNEATFHDSIYNLMIEWVDCKEDEIKREEILFKIDCCLYSSNFDLDTGVSAEVQKQRSVQAKLDIAEMMRPKGFEPKPPRRAGESFEDFAKRVGGFPVSTLATSNPSSNRLNKQEQSRLFSFAAAVVNEPHKAAHFEEIVLNDKDSTYYWHTVKSLTKAASLSIENGTSLVSEVYRTSCNSDVVGAIKFGIANKEDWESRQIFDSINKNLNNLLENGPTKPEVSCDGNHITVDLNPKKDR